MHRDDGQGVFKEQQLLEVDQQVLPVESRTAVTIMMNTS